MGTCELLNVSYPHILNFMIVYYWNHTMKRYHQTCIHRASWLQNTHNLGFWVPYALIQRLKLKPPIFESKPQQGTSKNGVYLMALLIPKGNMGFLGFSGVPLWFFLLLSNGWTVGPSKLLWQATGLSPWPSGCFLDGVRLVDPKRFRDVGRNLKRRESDLGRGTTRKD